MSYFLTKIPLSPSLAQDFTLLCIFRYWLNLLWLLIMLSIWCKSYINFLFTQRTLFISRALYNHQLCIMRYWLLIWHTSRLLQMIHPYCTSHPLWNRRVVFCHIGKSLRSMTDVSNSFIIKLICFIRMEY